MGFMSRGKRAFWAGDQWLDYHFYLRGLQCSTVKGGAEIWDFVFYPRRITVVTLPSLFKFKKHFDNMYAVILGVQSQKLDPVILMVIPTQHILWFCDHVQKLECHSFLYRVLSVMVRWLFQDKSLGKNRQIASITSLK